MSRVTLLVMVIFLILASSVFATEGRSQDPKEISITLTMEAPLKDVLAELKKQSGLRFVYAEEVGNIPGVKVTVRDKSLHHVLKEIATQKHLRFDQSNNLIAVSKTSAAKKKALKPGTVTGQIIDESAGEPLIGATVMVTGTTIGTVTDVEGKYKISLDPGSYDIEFRFVGYQVKLITGIIISDGQITSLNVVMKPEASSLSEVVITAEYSKASVEGLLVKQKNNVSMTDGMSQEQIRLTPDNNTAQVLKRVSGVTVQGDRFVTIRGLSDRYNNVMINGASAPSTEPNRRNFAFDIVPSAMVDNVVVNKTASPDLPGEFTGGIVMVNTKEIPDKNFLNFTYGRGVNTNTTGKAMVSTRRDKYAVLGIVDEEKKWFGDGRTFDPQQYYRYLSAGDDHAMDSISAKIPNRWKLYQYPYTPMQNYQLSGGMVKELKQARVGFTSALTYRNEQTIESGELGMMFNENYKYASQRYKYNTSIGALFNTAYNSVRHKLSWKNLYNNRYSNQFDDQFGFTFGSTQKQHRTSNVTLANRLIQSRLEGEHSLTRAGIKLSWNADITDLLREQPDGRFVIGYLSGDGIDDPELHTEYNFNESFVNYGGLYGAVMNESKKSAGANVSVPFQVLRARQVIKAGYSLWQRESEYDGTFLRVLGAGGTISQNLRGLPYYEIATPERFATHQLRYFSAYTKSSTTGDRYEGDQKLRAYYGMVDLTFLKKLRATGGVRYEDSRMFVNTVFFSTKTGASYDSIKSYTERDWLPSVNLIFSATKKFNIRASYSKTLTRPDFVERSPYIYFDFAENVQVIGQRELKITRISNYDFRLEYYFTPGEILSASVFYKEFSNPVERFFNTGNNSNSVVYANLYSAEARGIEFNVIKSLNFTGIADHWSGNFYLSGNYTVLKGSIKALIPVKIDGRDTTIMSSYDRPVQGLAPYAINGGLAYQTSRWGLNVSYNKFGRRIVNGGSGPRHVQYEMPRDVVDVQLNWYMLQKKLIARVNISDLLNQPFVLYANNSQVGDAPNEDPKGDEYNPAYDYVTYNVKKGTNYSFSLTYNF